MQVQEGSELVNTMEGVVAYMVGVVDVLVMYVEVKEAVGVGAQVRGELLVREITLHRIFLGGIVLTC